jgi:hypothetical protein|nr:MAG TPA: YaaA [Caudoviricetes sp.]
MIVIITCGKAKQRCSAKAVDMYIGSVFKGKLKYAKTLYPGAPIYILSAKYGIIPADLVIEPYDLLVPDRENDFFRDWSNKVINQLQGFDKGEDIVFLGNQHYFKPVDAYFVGKKQAPLLGLSPGKQLARLSEELDEVRNKQQRKLF